MDLRCTGCEGMDLLKLVTSWSTKIRSAAVVYKKSSRIRSSKRCMISLNLHIVCPAQISKFHIPWIFFMSF